MIELRLSCSLSFGKKSRSDTKKSNKCVPRMPRLSNQPPKNRDKEIFFRKFSDRLIEKTRKENRSSCANNYHTAVGSFLEFMGKSDFPVTHLNQSLAKRYEQWLWERDISHNTSSCYMRSLRAIYNKVVEKCHIKDSKPFSKVFTGNDETKKRAIGKSAIIEIANLTLKAGTRLCLARDLFMFCFYAMGMPFVDVAHLKKCNIEGDVLKYYRHKTGIQVGVKLEPCALEIIRRYSNPASEYLFPVLRGKTVAEKEGSYNSALSYHNRLLKKIGKMVGLTQPLTSYVVRHSWASTAYDADVSINVISKALGHSSPAITLTYIDELKDDRVFKANKKVLKEIKVLPTCKRQHTNRQRFVFNAKST